jgi:Zn-dependent M28 family amino/carboxypeptidase
LAIVAIFAGSTTVSAQIRFKQLPKETIQSRLEMAKSKNSDREQTLKQMFVDAGCPNVTEAKVKGDADQNVVCVLPGKSERTIVVGAHFDHVKVGDGVVDNWSGASLLPSLMESILRNDREHTVIFVGFTAEGKGMVGSKAYVMTPNTVQFLHSPKDKMDAIKMDDYYATYRLSAAYLVMLDQGLDRKVPAETQAGQATGESKSQ